MGRAIIRGVDSLEFLQIVATNNVKALNLGEGHYSLICNEQGGIKDDVVIFHLKDHEYFIVYNAGNRSKDVGWFHEQAERFNVEIEDVSDQVAMFAIQGPDSVKVLERLSSERVGPLPRFGCKWNRVADVKTLISRTGYTGEDGFEIFVWDSPLDNPRPAQLVWEQILAAGRPECIEPCGLGARDVLRLEAGLCLYGADMDEKTNPYEARLGFAVKLEKDFIGRLSLREVKRLGPNRIRIGLVTDNRVIPRHDFEILQLSNRVGTITSGSLSPTLDKGIAMGYVNMKEVNDSLPFQIRIRGRVELAKLVKPPFYDTTRFGYARNTPSNPPA